MPRPSCSVIGLCASLALVSLSVHAQESATSTPAQAFINKTTNLDRLPAGWVVTKPIQLDVAFNLKALPNSPEAEAFLTDWYASIRALPDHVELKLVRVVSPARYLYAVTLTFRNWAEYRTYESSPAFLRYYRNQWKPAVAELEERLSIVDPITPVAAGL